MMTRRHGDAVTRGKSGHIDLATERLRDLAKRINTATSVIPDKAVSKYLGENLNHQPAAAKSGL